jgi:hypothetical protein
MGASRTGRMQGVVCVGIDHFREDRSEKLNRLPLTAEQSTVERPTTGLLLKRYINQRRRVSRTQGLEQCVRRSRN